MPRRKIVAVALSLALAAVIGTVALSKTIHLGQASAGASGAVVTRRTVQLNRFEASLKTELAKKTPALPKASIAGALAAPARSAAQRVVYVRPKPIVITKHRPGGEYEHESDHGTGFDD